MARKKAEADIKGDSQTLQDTVNNTEVQNTPPVETVVTETTTEKEVVKEGLQVQEQPLQQGANNDLADLTVKTVVTGPTNDAKKTKKDSNEGKTSKDEKDPEPEIPDTAKNVLKRYPSEEELYIDKFGGVYTKDTQHSLVKNAILYKNPFYNKNK